jgi:hypothetical protein
MRLYGCDRCGETIPSPLPGRQNRRPDGWSSINTTNRLGWAINRLICARCTKQLFKEFMNQP